MTALLEAAQDEAFRRLAAVGGDLARLPLPARTLVLVTSAQGVLDNGGLAYFFSGDFPGAPSYDEFVAAYRRIGAEVPAQRLEAAVARFPFDRPQRRLAERRRWIERDPGAFDALDDGICGASEPG